MKVIPQFGMRTSILFLFLNILHAGFPANEASDTDIRALSLGQVNSLSQELVNPAFLSFQEQRQIGLSVFNRFKMEELSTESVYAAFPNRLLNAGFKLSAYGYDDYQLLRGQMALSKKLTPHFSIGTNFILLHENSVMRDEAANDLRGDAGLFWQINESFDWAFCTENLLHTKKNVPTLYATGLNYRILSNCVFLMETESDFQNYLDFKFGIEYEIEKQFSIRGGFRSNPETPSLGFVYSLNSWKVETSFLLHPALGLSSGIDVIFSF
ncbi:hypothetical protein FACS1894123_05100 [Bacteroidia bacterium]|nr:hypothetical protein FACS1894123_05100 [Bacteroidia bacterium]